MSALSSLFISHGSRDHAIAREVGRRLRSRGTPASPDRWEIGHQPLGDMLRAMFVLKPTLHLGLKPRISGQLRRLRSAGLLVGTHLRSMLALVTTVIASTGIIAVHRLRHGAVALLADQEATISADLEIRTDPDLR